MHSQHTYKTRPVAMGQNIQTEMHNAFPPPPSNSLIFLPHKCLRAGLGLASTLDLPGLRTSDVVGGDPVGVVGGGGRDGRGGGLLDGGGFALGTARGALLAGLAALALLWEVGGDPDGVEEVDGTSGAGQEEEVEEEAVQGQGQGQGQSIAHKGEGRVLTPGDRRCWSRAQPRSQCH